jgi:hypothetical protein
VAVVSGCGVPDVGGRKRENTRWNQEKKGNL